MVNHIRLQVTKSSSIQQKIHCSEHGHYLALDRLETFAKKLLIELLHVRVGSVSMNSQIGTLNNPRNINTSKSLNKSEMLEG